MNNILIVHYRLCWLSVCFLNLLSQSLLTVNYTPSGFSAYEVPDGDGGPTKPERGGTGMPVAIQLSLQFKETEMRTKQSYENEYELRTPEEIQQSNSLKDFYG